MTGFALGLASAVPAVLALLAPAAALAAGHAIAMHGRPALGPEFSHFGYVNPAAPKGGALRLGRLGAFDSLNPFIVRGRPAAGIRATHMSLLERNWNEPFTLYAGLAETVTMAEDRSWVEFRLRQGARFHDGAEVTVEDVIFSWQTLKRQGRPNHRHYYRQVSEISRPAPRTVRFHFAGDGNSELPLIMGLMAVLPKAALAAGSFDRVSLAAIAGAGPYRVAEVDAGRAITYRRIPGHWSENLPALRGRHNFAVIRYLYFGDDATRQLAFQSGALDLVWESDPRRWALGYDFPAARRGEVRREEIGHGRPAGFHGLVWNTRRKKFQDPRVRRALGHAFDFAWLNRNFYHGAFQRTESYFANSALAAVGRPTGAELSILAPHRGQLPVDLFEQSYLPPGDARLGSLRQRLRLADLELKAAGWPVKDLARVNAASGARLDFEIMLINRGDERLALAYAKNLERLGIRVSVRTVDSAQYQARLTAFDFDAILHRWGQSLSPGNEQAFYWGSQAAGEAGSRNYPGIRNPVVDALIDRLTGARRRQDLLTAARALDRVLLWGEYILPLFHSGTDRLARWRHLAHPVAPPLYGTRLDTWWSVPRSKAD